MTAMTTTRRARLGALVCAALATSAVPPPATTTTTRPLADDELPAELEPYEGALRRLARLRGGKKEELLAQVRAAIDALETPQTTRIAALLSDAVVRRDALEAPTEFGFHDPELWDGPRRSTIRAGSSRWRQMQRQLVDPEAEAGRLLTAEVFYEWATGEIVATPERDRDSESLWRNLLLGFHPEQDFAEALLLQRLDDARPLALQAHWFAHDYADLRAKVYEGLSLFDVWTHEIPNDVPDVDARAFAKTVYDTSLPTPLRGKHKQEWYPKIRDDALRLMRQRFAAEAVAALWLQGEPQLERGYTNTINYLQAFLATAEEDFAPVLERFQQGSYGFVDSVHAEIEAVGHSAYSAGSARMAALAAGRQAIREAVLEVLRAEGYVD